MVAGLLGFAAVVCLSGLAEAFTLASPKTCARVIVGVDEPDCVFLAAADLTNDVRRICGRDLALQRGGAACAGDVFITTRRDGRWEAYAVRENAGVLEIVGSDARGTMFGVYDFIERYLGVDPMEFWSDVAPVPRKELQWEKVEIVQDSPSFRFRGWFLNDEDMLTMWRKASGVRDYSTYWFYNDVVNHEVMARVAESLVRARMNLIVPASFLNLTRPAEETLVAICARRGVFVSMHHVEPLGVSGYTFKDYWKKRGRDLPFSYFKHPQEVEETWRALIRRWAKYPNVIWQIGLRGTADRPTWDEDPTMPRDDVGRARLISNALARQIQILNEEGVPKDGRVVAITLWGEGTYFNVRGLLTIPPGTTIVYADNNCGWKWQPDLLSGRRPAGCGAGVYYHHQLIGMGPHLVSLVPAAKTYEMLAVAAAKGASDYAIFNIGNVREFVYGIDATAKMTWNLGSFDPTAWTAQWLVRRVPSNVRAWETALNVYYRAQQISEQTAMPRFLDGQLTRKYVEVATRLIGLANGTLPRAPDPEPAALKPPANAASDPFAAVVSEMHPPLLAPSETIAALAAQRAGYAQALRSAQIALAGTAEGERRFARDFLVYPPTLMYGVTDGLLQMIVAEQELRAGESAKALAAVEDAAGALEKVVLAGLDYCRGDKWCQWYRGCEKISIRWALGRTREVIETIQKFHHQSHIRKENTL